MLPIDHVLDNPVWNAMISYNGHLATGTGQVKLFPEDIGPFAGLKSLDSGSLQQLYELLCTDREVVIIIAGHVQIPGHFKVIKEGHLYQMTGEKVKQSSHDNMIVPLRKQHVPQMLELTQLTNPGPFRERTIEFGDYSGIFNSGRLIAMAGQRMHPDHYIEISAVCTHPEYTGKGYSSSLIIDQASQIANQGNIPFLHVNANNENAVRLYKKLGFAIRRQMNLYVIKKSN